MAVEIESLGTRSIDDDLDYTADFGTNWLSDGELIVTPTAECEVGDTVVDRIGTDGTRVTFWLSGGTHARSLHTIAITVTTDAGRTKKELRTITVLD